MEKPWKVILAFLGVFIAGAVFGGFFSLGIGRRIWEIEAPPAAKPSLPTLVPAAPAVAPGQPVPPPPAPQSVQSAQLLRRVTNQLNLTRTQRERITPVIDRALQDFWRQQQNFARENGFLLQRLKQDIGLELTQEQQKRLDDLWTKQLDLLRQRQAEALAQRRSETPVQPKPAGEAPVPPAPAAKSTVDASVKSPATNTQAPPAPAAKPSDGTNK